MSRKVPEKGKPNFYHLNNTQLNGSFDLIEQLLCSYKEFPEVCETLKVVWGDLRAERLDRESFIDPVKPKSEDVSTPKLKLHKFVGSPIKKHK